MQPEKRPLVPLTTIDLMGPATIGSGMTPTGTDTATRSFTIVVSFFWTAFVLAVIAQPINNTSHVLAIVCLVVSLLLHAANIVFLVLGRVPGSGRIRGKGCDCSCSCLSRPYAVASAVFFAGTLINIIITNV